MKSLDILIPFNLNFCLYHYGEMYLYFFLNFIFL